MASQANPLRQIMDIRREEAPMALLMFLYFFLVISSFWILKPLKKGLFIGFHKMTGFDLFFWHLTASQSELIAKVLNMVVAFVAVTAFTLLARTFQRQQLAYIFSVFFIACYIIYGGFLSQPDTPVLTINLETAEILEASPEATDISGHTRDELVGTRLWDLRSLGEKERAKVFFQEIGEVVNGFVKKKGEETGQPPEQITGAVSDLYFNLYFQKASGERKLVNLNARVTIQGNERTAFLLMAPTSLTVWSFYLFGDLFSTLMVATFFVFLNDSVDPDSAKRIYGLIGLGGVSGGWFGTEVLRTKISDLSYSEWLWVCLGVAVVIILIAAIVGRIVARRPPPAATPPEEHAEKPEGNPALEGARLVFRSPYLLSIVAIVGIYEMVSTTMDFQFSATIEHYLSGAAIKEQFATVFNFTNRVAFFVQLFLTSFIMTRFGVGAALLFLPVAALLGSAGFLIAPVLLVGSALNTCDNGFSYSINQSAKEVLYVPTTREEKYKAKAFIDMFVQRFAKALAVGLSLVITITFVGFGSLRWLSLITVVMLLVWVYAVRYAGRAFGEMEGTPPRVDK